LRVGQPIVLSNTNATGGITLGYGSPSSGSTVQELLDITNAVEAARIANLTDVA